MAVEVKASGDLFLETATRTGTTEPEVRLPSPVRRGKTEKTVQVSALSIRAQIPSRHGGVFPNRHSTALM